MDRRAVVFILLGQSNAVGHNLPMAPGDVIKKPLNNVYGLHRSKNQSYEITEVQWDHYVSTGMNLAEEQDNTYSVANCLAARWQQAIDGGRDLPDLYVVQIAIGAQGVMPRQMWHPDEPRRLIPGKLGEVNISLHSFTRHILTLVRQSMAALGKEPIYLMHWRGGEQEIWLPKATLQGQLQSVYERLFADYCMALGKTVPICLHRILCDRFAVNAGAAHDAVDSLRYVNEVFEALSRTYPHMAVFDPRQCPCYDPDDLHLGLLQPDDAHFTREVNAWVAAKILDNLSS